MTGIPYSITPVTLHLTTSKINPRAHSISPLRHQQQLQYEPDSAKCFIYRTEMHIQNSLPTHTLPHIRSKSSSLEKGNYYGLSTEIANRSKAALPNIEPISGVPNQQDPSHKGSGCSVKNAEFFEEAQIEILRDRTSSLSFSPEDETAQLFPGKNETSYDFSNMDTQLEGGISSPSCYNKSLSGTKTPKKKHRKKKGKSRKSEGRKSKTFNHRLKSAKRVAYIDSDQDKYLTASQHIRSPVLHNRCGSEPLGLVGAQVKPIVVVQRESPKKTTSQRLFHSAGRPAHSQSSPRLQPRSKTHLTLSPARLAPTSITFSNAVLPPKTSWMGNNLSAQESSLRHIQELTAINSHRSPAPSPRVSQELRKLTKVYLSEQQSGKLQELGIDLPCAPPATPAPEMYEKYEYIPSMADIRAQRAVKTKLDILERQERKVQEKLLEAKLKRDKKEVKEKEKAHRRSQRREIYALNKVMTELEHANFREFCKAKGIDPKV